MLMPVAFFWTACEQDAGEDSLVIRRIQYDVPIQNPDPEDDWWVENVVGPQREEILKMVLEKVRKGEVRAYDYFHEPLTPEQIIQLETDTIFKTLKRETAPYDEYDTMIIEKLEISDIKKIRFLEEWSMDKKTLGIEKKVAGIAPVKIVRLEDREFNLLLFWVYLDEAYPAVLKN